jgi:hypothetical protein
MTEIYTLPTCPICEMVKKKLTTKAIPFMEHSFEKLPEGIDTDRAPVMAVPDEYNRGHLVYLLTPTSINDWIKAV